MRIIKLQLMHGSPLVLIYLGSVQQEIEAFWLQGIGDYSGLWLLFLGFDIKKRHKHFNPNSSLVNYISNYN